MNSPSENRKQMSFGKKLMIAFGAMFVATLALGIAAWTGISGLRNELDFSANTTDKSLKVISGATTDIAELRSYERGILLRFFMKDKATAERYKNSFAETTRRLSGEMEQLKPLTDRKEVKQAIADVESTIELWRPVHEDLWNTG